MSTPKVLAEAEKAAAIADLNAQWDRRLARLNADAEASRAAMHAFMTQPLRLDGRVLAGEIDFSELRDSAFSTLDEADAWYAHPYLELGGLTPREASDASVEGHRKVRALLEDLIKTRRGLTDQDIVRAVSQAINSAVDLRDDHLYTASWGVVEGRGSLTKAATQKLLAWGHPPAVVSQAAQAGFLAYAKAIRGTRED